MIDFIFGLMCFVQFSIFTQLIKIFRESLNGYIHFPIDRLYYVYACVYLRWIIMKVYAINILSIFYETHGLRWKYKNMYIFLGGQVMAKFCVKDFHLRISNYIVR